MIKRNFIKTTLATIGATLIPSFGVSKYKVNKSDEWEDIAAKIIAWLPSTNSKVVINDKDTYHLINAIHNNDEVYAYRGIGKSLSTLLLAAYQSIVENKKVWIVPASALQEYCVKTLVSKLGFANDNILFKRLGDCTSQIDVAYCKEPPTCHHYHVIKNMTNVKSVKRVLGRQDKLEITVIKNGIKKSYAPSLEFERTARGIMDQYGHKVEFSDSPRWC